MGHAHATLLWDTQCVGLTLAGHSCDCGTLVECSVVIGWGPIANATTTRREEDSTPKPQKLNENRFATHLGKKRALD